VQCIALHGKNDNDGREYKQPILVDLQQKDRLAAHIQNGNVLHYHMKELGELLQWQCCDDITINVVLTHY